MPSWQLAVPETLPQECIELLNELGTGLEEAVKKATDDYVASLSPLVIAQAYAFAMAPPPDGWMGTEDATLEEHSIPALSCTMWSTIKDHSHIEDLSQKTRQALFEALPLTVQQRHALFWEACLQHSTEPYCRDVVLCSGLRASIRQRGLMVLHVSLTGMARHLSKAHWHILPQLGEVLRAKIQRVLVTFGIMLQTAATELDMNAQAWPPTTLAGVHDWHIASKKCELSPAAWREIEDICTLEQAAAIGWGDETGSITSHDVEHAVEQVIAKLKDDHDRDQPKAVPALNWLMRPSSTTAAATENICSNNGHRRGFCTPDLKYSGRGFFGDCISVHEGTHNEAGAQSSLGGSFGDCFLVHEGTHSEASEQSSLGGSEAGESSLSMRPWPIDTTPVKPPLPPSMELQEVDHGKFVEGGRMGNLQDNMQAGNDFRIHDFAEFAAERKKPDSQVDGTGKLDGGAQLPLEDWEFLEQLHATFEVEFRVALHVYHETLRNAFAESLLQVASWLLSHTKPLPASVSEVSEGATAELLDAFAHSMQCPEPSVATITALVGTAEAVLDTWRWRLDLDHHALRANILDLATRDFNTLKPVPYGVLKELVQENYAPNAPKRLELEEQLEARSSQFVLVQVKR